MIFREEKYSFRFTNLTPDSANRLKRSLPSVEVGLRRPDVAVLEIDEAMDLNPLVSFLQTEHLAPATYSIWASLVTSSDNGGLSLPESILKLIRVTNCGVDFSFAASLGDKNEDG